MICAGQTRHLDAHFFTGCEALYKTVAHPDLSKYRHPNMLVVRLSSVNLFPPTTLKGVGLRPTTHYSMVFN